MKNKEAALDLIRAGKEDTASATAEIPAMKEPSSLDLVTAEVGALDRNGKEESAAAAATAEIIRTKKREVLDLMRAKRRMREESMPAGTEGENGTEEEKKRKKVVRRMFPPAIIDFLMAKLCRPVEIIPDDVLATYSQRVRDSHVMRMAIDKKLREYDQAIVNQYWELGYTIDETEVTDDEMEN